MTWLEVLIRVMRWVGFLALVPGLWYLAGGLRVVVSGRIDERNRSGQSIKKGVLLSIAGIVVLAAGALLGTWMK